MMKYKQILGKSRINNEGFVDTLKSLFGGSKAPITDRQGILKEVLKNSQNLKSTLGNPTWVSANLKPQETSPLWSHLAKSDSVPKTLRQDLRNEKDQALTFAKTGASKLSQRAALLSKIRSQVDNLETEDHNAAIIKAYGHVPPVFSGQDKTPVFLGGQWAEIQNNKLVLHNGYDKKVPGLNIDHELYASLANDAIAAIGQLDGFINQWNSLEFFEVPGIDTSEGVWRYDDVSFENKQIQTISDNVDSEGLVQKLEELYLSPVKFSLNSNLSILQLMSNFIKTE